VGFVVSNFQEAPNGGGAGGNQAPAGPSSLRERCDGRGINPHPVAKYSRAVALRTRENLANRLYQTKIATLWCARRVPGSSGHTKLYKRVQACPASHCGHHSTTVRLY
jgi:hypothetical protein